MSNTKKDSDYEKKSIARKPARPKVTKSPKPDTKK
jgi:hypothetical protein